MTLVPPISGRRGLVLLSALLGTVAVVAVWSWRSRPQPEPMAAPVSAQSPQPRGVSALGRLNPAGNVRRLDAPSGAMGASPRVETLLVEEGDRVEAGQVLAQFDTYPDQLADFEVAKATIDTLEQRQKLLQEEVLRYQNLLSSGAISAEILDIRRLKLLSLEQELRKAKAQLQRQRIKLPDGELVAPFSGTVLEIFARPGERPSSDGVLSIGRSDQMEAVLEVYESDIGRVRVGQRVLLQSENGGFDGELQGRVRRIDPLVQQRDVLSTDPTADTDARVVEVHVTLDPADARRVRQLTGLKLIGRLQP
ncbi:efflux RND transporter periplasmic adaptor subunit [Synechococcus sp. MIT S9452]|uniref:efflux RND transporter periplasmic adaptor subunit n=1 Tax=Synechococcus sp. MIT S9452 TaxID=3082546 RepID=UPI0039A567F7